MVCIHSLISHQPVNVPVYTAQHVGVHLEARVFRGALAPPGYSPPLHWRWHPVFILTARRVHDGFPVLIVIILKVGLQDHGPLMAAIHALGGMREGRVLSKCIMLCSAFVTRIR